MREALVDTMAILIRLEAKVKGKACADAAEAIVARFCTDQALQLALGYLAAGAAEAAAQQAAQIPPLQGAAYEATQRLRRLKEAIGEIEALMADLSDEQQERRKQGQSQIWAAKNQEFFREELSQLKGGPGQISALATALADDLWQAIWGFLEAYNPPGGHID